MSSLAEKNMNGGGIDDDVEVIKEMPEASAATKVSSSNVEGSLSLMVNGKGGSKVLFPGDITIKAQLEDDIRCINYNNQELTFVDLLKLLERMFKKAIKATDDLVIKYKDGEGDFVTMEDTDDVGFAIRTCGGLNIKILRVVKSKQEPKLKCSDTIRAELTEIRDRANKLLDRLEGNDIVVSGTPSSSSVKDSVGPSVSNESLATVPRTSQVSIAAPTVLTTSSVLPVAAIEATEFDPLNGVTSTDDRRQGNATIAVQQPPPQSVSSTPIKQVIDSFQPTPRGDVQTAGVVSSITANPRTDQPNQPFSQQQSQQHASSLFDVGHGIASKVDGVANYSPIPSQSAQSQYTAASQMPGVQQQQPQQQPVPPQPLQQPHSNVPSNTMYNTVPPANMYGSSNQYQYQTSTPSYGAPAAPQPSSYSHLPNTTPTSMNSSWNDTSANTQARAYTHMGINSSITPGGQQGSMSPMPASTGQAIYGTNLQSTPQMFGQMGGGVQPPPPVMSGAQAPPQMPGSQGPPMGSQYRPGSSAPPPPTGAGAAASANPYSRTASNSTFVPL